jgi:molecular chaperone GrpE
MNFFDEKNDKNSERVVNENGEETSSPVQAAPSELETCKQEALQWKDRYMRTRADFDNFSRRVEKESQQVGNFVQAEVLLEVLTIVDDFDRALEEHKKHDTTPEKQAWLAGFEMIRVSFEKMLEKFGVKPLDNYTTFDPLMHEAISHIPVEGKESGAIVHVAQKGYLRNGVVLRPAKVVVAK